MTCTNSSEAGHRWGELCRNPAQAVRWDWRALLRLVQCAAAERPCLGYGVQLRDDPIRLGQPPHLYPSPVEIHALLWRGPREGTRYFTAQPSAEAGSERSPESVPWLLSYHFGLFGPRGPLPLHLTELAYRLDRRGDPALAAFCNVLQHRFLCFFFRAWADARKEIGLDRAAAPVPDHEPSTARGSHRALREDTHWALYFGCLIGLGAETVWCRDWVPDQAKLYYAGWLLQPTRGAEGLQAILQDYFGVPTRVVQFVPRTVPLPATAHWILGSSSTAGWLGRSTIVGEKVEDPQMGFRIRLGPLDLNSFERFLPCGSPKFVPEDIRNLPGLAARLVSRTDPLSAWLWTRCAEPTRALLAGFCQNGGPAEPVKVALAQDLTRVIQGPLIYSAERFAGVGLSEATRQMLDKPLHEPQRCQLNRQLLQEAFPEDFASSPNAFGQLHDWVRLYVGRQTDGRQTERDPKRDLEPAWDLQLVLRATEVPRLVLGTQVQLGWTTWLMERPAPNDLDDLHLRPPKDKAWPREARLAATAPSP